MRRTILLGSLLAFLCTCGGATTRSAEPADPVQPEPPGDRTPTPAADASAPASLAGLADEGTFLLYVNETPFATIAFTWRADGGYEGKATVSYAGQTFDSTVKITVDANGRWTRVDADAPTGAVAVVRDGVTASTTHSGKTVTTELVPGATLFENFSPALMAQLLRAYDRAAAGTQTIPVYVVGARVVQAKLTFKDEVLRAQGGRDLTLARYDLDVEGVELLVYADAATGKIIAADVPAQHAAYVRQGYEAVLVAAEEDPKLSKPEHEVVVERGLEAPMRDGVKLAVDVYRPAGDGKHPVILVRTPYKKELAEFQGAYFARRGYAYAVQDVRGRFASGGVWEPFVNERKDGYDSVEWAAKQPWSNGKVGMIGASYLGWVQWWAAVEKPPHLVTIIPNVAPPDPFFNVPYEHGVFFLLGAIWWAEVVASEATADVSGATYQKIVDRKYAQLLRALPVIDLDKALFGAENPHWRAWITHSTNDAYWARGSYLDDLDRVNIPVFHQSGWFDGDGIGSKLAYGRMAKLKKKHQKLILGPWGHTDEASRRLGDRDFGPEAVAIDLQREYLRWFDRWLKGVDNGIEREPLVKVFAMGSNRWYEGNTYPLEGTVMEKWYFGANGALTREAPAADGSDSYVYDPGDPTPDPDHYEPPEPAEGEVISAEARRREREGWHAKVVAGRKDILVYQSEPLSEDTTFVGPVGAVLYAATTARDTDWFVTLVEVDADGKLFPLVVGKLRARFRTSWSKPKLLTPEKVYEYTIDMWQTGITVKKGHRLRIEVASASFPTFSRNLNTGGHNELETEFVSATQTIWRGGRYTSYVVLPRVK